MPTKDITKAIALLRMTGGSTLDAQQIARKYHIVFSEDVWRQAESHYWNTDCQDCGD